MPHFSPIHVPTLPGRPLEAQSDERLVELFRAGDTQAFEAIVGRYRRPLLRYCTTLLTPERAEDAVQATLISAYETIVTTERAMALRPWLYRVARNASLDALRDRSLRHEELVEGINGVERPDQAFERRESVREALAAVRALPANQRDAVVLREFEGRSYDEMAERLGVTRGAVRQLLARARASLRSGLNVVLPPGLVQRLANTGPADGVAGRFADLGGIAGAGAVVTQLGVAAMLTGSVAFMPFAGGAERSTGPAAQAGDGVGTLRVQASRPGSSSPPPAERNPLNPHAPQVSPGVALEPKPEPVKAPGESEPVKAPGQPAQRREAPALRDWPQRAFEAPLAASPPLAGPIDAPSDGNMGKEGLPPDAGTPVKGEQAPPNYEGQAPSGQAPPPSAGTSPSAGSQSAPANGVPPAAGTEGRPPGDGSGPPPPAT